MPRCGLLVLVGLAVLQLCGCESVARAQSNEDSVETQIWQTTDLTTLLALLKRRDAEFDRRSVIFDKEWTEQVSPNQYIHDLEFHALKFGQKSASVLREEGEKVPDDYKQPYRWRYRMTVREPDIVLENVASLKPMKDSRFSYQFTLGQKIHSANGVVRMYNPNLKLKEGQGWTNPMQNESTRTLQRSAEWSCGYGLHKWITSIDSMRQAGDRLVIEGKMRLLADDTTTFKMELDRDGIMRRVDIAIPGKPDGADTYIVETEGSAYPETAPAVAQAGRYRRILKPAGKPEQLYVDHKFRFVSASSRLTDDEYQKTLEISADLGLPNRNFAP